MGKCEVCGKSGGYAIENKNWKTVKKVLFFFNNVSHNKEFCKEHFLETYEKLFLENSAPTVVFDPGSGKKACSFYAFENLEMTKNTFMPPPPDMSDKETARIYPKVYDVLKNALDTASTTCGECSKTATMIYYPVIWDEFVKNMYMEPEYLCQKCAYEKIKGPIFDTSDKYLVAPHQTDYGICVGVIC